MWRIVERPRPVGCAAYIEWRNFKEAVQAAMKAREGSGNTVSDHFDPSIKMISLGKGAQRRVDDWQPRTTPAT
jgi:hypothetical protein